VHYGYKLQQLPACLKRDEMVSENQLNVILLNVMVPSRDTILLQSHNFLLNVENVLTVILPKVMAPK
jgi:hypothetical protein